MSHEKYFDQANLIPTPLPYELERQGDELLLVHWFQRDDKAMLKREIAVLCNWNDKGQDELDGKFLLQSLSELESLKAQLAASESIRKAEKKILIEEIRLRSESEAQVRELRELLSNAFEECAGIADSMYNRRGFDVGQEIRKRLNKNKELAALRSAPPDVIWKNGERWMLEDDKSGYFRLLDLAPNLEREYIRTHPNEVPAKQAPFAKTNAGEERKDLARQKEK